MTDPPGTPQADPQRWETVLDPVEQAFTIAMPRGWQNRAWLKRTGVSAHSLVTTTSPDGSTAFFSGDPTLPLFVEPGAAPFGVAPGSVVRQGTSIKHFLPGWAHHRFGRLPGFRIVGMMPSPQLLQLVHDRARRGAAPLAWATAGRLAFVFQEGERPVNGLVFGATSSFGQVWLAEVHGITTTGDPEPMAASLLGMVASNQTTPAAQQRVLQERAASAARHQATMASIAQNTAQMTANHQQNMANLQASAQSHQDRMASLHASHDASNAAWSAQQARADAHPLPSGDDAHRRFLNTIAEERTVVDGEGNTHQVADGYDRYFYRRSDGAWIGLPSHQDLSSVRGLDPNGFEEVTIKR